MGEEIQAKFLEMQREMDKLRASIPGLISEGVAKAMASFTIKNGQNISFSGSGFQITADVIIPQGVLQGSVQCVDDVGVLTGTVTFG